MPATCCRRRGRSPSSSTTTRSTPSRTCPSTRRSRRAAQVFGCQPYLTEDRYREELTRGRIRFDELQEVLEQDLGDRGGGEDPLLRHAAGAAAGDAPVPAADRADRGAGLVRRRGRTPCGGSGRRSPPRDRGRLIAETRRWVIRDLRGVRRAEPRTARPKPARRPRVPDSLAELLDRFGESTMEYWSDERLGGVHAPGPLAGLLRRGPRPAAVHLAAAAAGPPPRPAARGDRRGRRPARPRAADPVLRGVPGPGAGPLAAARPRRGLLPRLLPLLPPAVRAAGPLDARAGRRSSAGCEDEGSARWSRSGSRWRSSASPRRSGSDSSPPRCWRCAAGRAWSGRSRSAATGSSSPVPRGSLVEFLAIRLVLDRLALAYTARRPSGSRAPSSELCATCARRRIEPPWPPSVEQRAFLVFQLAQVIGLSPDVLYRLSKPEWATMLEEIESFTGARAAARSSTSPTSGGSTRRPPTPWPCTSRHPAPTPGARRGSRRSSASTSGRSRSAATWRSWPPTPRRSARPGSSRVAMYYRGVADAHFVPLCPAVIRPAALGRRAGDREPRGAATGAAPGRGGRWAWRRTGSTSAAGRLTAGAVLAAVVGVLASIPLVARHPVPAAHRADQPAGSAGSSSRRR